MKPKACTGALQEHSLACFWEVEVVTATTLQGRTSPCTLCVDSPVLEGQGCWHQDRWFHASLTQPCAPLKGRACSGCCHRHRHPLPQCAALLVGTAAALHLPVGTWITKLELPLYELNYFLTTLTTSLLSCIFNAVVEFLFFVCILMRGYWYKSSQIIKTLTFRCALSKKWSSVHGENSSHTEKCSTCKNIRYHIRYYGAARGDASSTVTFECKFTK